MTGTKVTTNHITLLSGAIERLTIATTVAILIKIKIITWTQVGTDGEQEIKQVRFDAANQRMIIGDDVKIYAINGNQMIIDDMDREAFDCIVLSK